MGQALDCIHFVQLYAGNLYACSCMRTDATECSLYALRLHIRNAATLHSFTLHTANDAQYRNMTCVCKLNASVGARTRTHAAVCARMLTSHARLTVASTGRYGGRRKRVDADVCARMRAAAVVCARMQTYARGGKRMRAEADVCAAEADVCAQ